MAMDTFESSFSVHTLADLFPLKRVAVLQKTARQNARASSGV